MLGGDLNSVNIEEIESIDVLKDGSAAAIYGTRGTNGVIIITTKRAKIGTHSLEFSTYASTQTVTKKLRNLKNESSSENIFVVPYDKVNTGGWDDGLILHLWSLHFLSSQTFGFIAFTWDGYAATESLYNSYDKTDKRINTWMEGPQATASGDPLMLAPGRQLTYRPHVKSLYNLADVALLDDGVRFKKYEFEKTLKDGESMSNDWVEFRYADVLMIKAEALMRKNGAATADVLALVNQVRSRAYGGSANNYTASRLTTDEFLAELGREFAWENHRRQDMIRFDKWNNAWFEKPAGDDHLKLFPIPNWVLDVSPQLKQNSEY